VDLLLALFLELEDGGGDGEESLLMAATLHLGGLNVRTEQMVFRLSPSILHCNSLLLRISHPAMPTINHFRPYYTGPFPHGSNRHLNRTTIKNDYQLLFKITQIHRPKPDRNGHSHPRRNISTVLFGINHTKNVELLLAQRGDLDSLQVLGLIDELDLCLIHAMQLVVVENDLLWNGSEF
jgi:hypothetical protein